MKTLSLGGKAYSEESDETYPVPIRPSCRLETRNPLIIAQILVASLLCTRGDWDPPTTGPRRQPLVRGAMGGWGQSQAQAAEGPRSTLLGTPWEGAKLGVVSRTERTKKGLEDMPHRADSPLIFSSFLAHLQEQHLAMLSLCSPERPSKSYPEKTGNRKTGRGRSFLFGFVTALLI